MFCQRMKISKNTVSQKYVHVAICDWWIELQCLSSQTPENSGTRVYTSAGRLVGQDVPLRYKMIHTTETRTILAPLAIDVAMVLIRAIGQDKLVAWYTIILPHRLSVRWSLHSYSNRPLIHKLLSRLYIKTIWGYRKKPTFSSSTDILGVFHHIMKFAFANVEDIFLYSSVQVGLQNRLRYSFRK